MTAYPCPCCGYLTLEEAPGSDEFCLLCGWQDDVSQLRFVTTPGANRLSLVEAQRNVMRFGVSDERRLARMHAPSPADHRDPDWRPVDLTRDRPETPIPGIDYGQTYPADRTTLYYWRRAAT